MKRYLLPASVVLLLVVVVLTAINLAGALGRVSVLTDQVEEWADSAEVYTGIREEIEARGDSIVELQDELEERDSVAAAEAREVVLESTRDTDTALAAAIDLAAAYPEVRDALIVAQTELQEEREARQEEQATSAAALFASQQRNRTLIRQIDDERVAHMDELGAVNTRLELALRAIGELENAIAPSFFRNALQNVELLLVGVATGAVGCLVFCP